MLGRKWYGKLQVALFGRDQWDNQNSGKVWSDGGAVRQVLDKATTDIERIVSENAIQSVSEFTASGIAAIRAADNGEVILGILLESSEARQILEISLREQLVAALKDMRPSLGIDEEAQAAFSALVTIARQIVALAPSERAAVPPPPETATEVLTKIARKGGRITPPKVAAEPAPGPVL